MTCIKEDAMKRKKKNIRRFFSPVGIFCVIFILALMIFSLFPVSYAILGSLKTNKELVSGASFLPQEWHWENFQYVFNKLNFLLYTRNSILVCAICMVLSIVLSSMGGFCMARYDFPGKKLFQTVNYSLMFISLGTVVLFPIYKMLNAIGLTGNLMGLSLVLTGGQTTNIVLVTGFVNNLPKELDESAEIDGAKPFQIYWHVLLPLLKPIIATVGLFTFRGAWNDYLNSMVFTLGRKNLQTLSVAIVSLRYSANAAAEWHYMCAGAVISIVPILVIYFFCNKQLIGGLTSGAVKG
jgi:ABC-type glycerol-3-phosphate transport system permease component